MKQTGLIITTPKIGEWVAGQETGIIKDVRVQNSDWTGYTPPGELQQKQFGFDTMACTTFSMLNSLETQLNYLKPTLSVAHKDFLELFGYNGNFSDRFSAIVSCTTDKGNTFPAVWEATRKHGVLPEKDLPFKGNTFAEYHNAKDITPYLLRKAKKFLDYFTVQYEWVNVDLINAQLKYSPIHIAIPNPAVHAEILINQSFMFDSYEPFIKLKQPIHFAMIGYLKPKADAPVFPRHIFTKVLKKGDKNADVTALQKILCYFGHMNVVTGLFGDVTVGALKEFQSVNGIEPVGQVGPLTQKFLNNLKTMPKSKGQIIYETSLQCLNTDMTPRDVVDDQVACAETVNAVVKKALGYEVGGGASTNLMYQALKSHKLFVEVFEPKEGDIIISPTGYGNGRVPNGHVGIVGAEGKIMSNSSPTGLFIQNFNSTSWNNNYKIKGGYPVKYYRAL